MISEGDSIPIQSDAALYARSVFFAQFNDVDFYVEDAEQENLYFAVLKKLFPDVRISRIFPLGGKGNVLTRAFDEPDPKRSSIYILDKDFDDHLGRVRRKDNVFYLERYCVENYFLEETAWVDFVVSELPKLAREAIQGAMPFEDSIRQAIRDLKKLFSLFFIALRYELPVPSTGQEPKDFCRKDDHGCVDVPKVELYAKRISRELQRKGVDEKLHVELERWSRLFDEGDLGATNISGEYVLWLVLQRTKTLFKCPNPSTLDSFRYRLAEYCELQSLSWLRERVEAYREGAAAE
jgi:hypothetical protein